MNCVDSHVHVWTQDISRYPLSSNYSVNDIDPKKFSPEDILHYARPCGVDRIVLVQMSYYGCDNSYMLEVMNRYGGIFSGIAIVNIEESYPDNQMRKLISQGVKGFRIQPDGPRCSWLDNPGYERMFHCATDEKVALCPLIDVDALPSLKRMCERFPDAPIIVDHICRIGVNGVIDDEDVAALCELAVYPMTFVKLSAFYALGKKCIPYTDLTSLIERVYRAFGSQRLMWGSDCPYQIGEQHTYISSLDFIRKNLPFLSQQDKHQVLYGTASKIFF